MAQNVSEADIGKRVFVSGYGEGTLQFVGMHHEKNELRCGVELGEPKGRNNGTVGGHLYFDCKPNFGILVPIAKVTSCWNAGFVWG